jgi:hypothetical protein
MPANIEERIGNSWYYMNRIDRTTTIYSLMDANTRDNPNVEMAQFSSLFRHNLKNGNQQIEDFILEYLYRQMECIPGIRETTHWDIYPSSDCSRNQALGQFKEYGESLSNKLITEPILIRNSPVEKRHGKLSYVRIMDGCDSQFDSMILNPVFRNELKDSSVCVLDDYSTYGTSCEAARHLLRKAGARKLTFLTIGKFGVDYVKYSYRLYGDVFGKYTYKRIQERGYGMPPGEMNDDATALFLKYLKEHKDE